MTESEVEKWEKNTQLVDLLSAIKQVKMSQSYVLVKMSITQNTRATSKLCRDDNGFTLRHQGMISKTLFQCIHIQPMLRTQELTIQIFNWVGQNFHLTTYHKDFQSCAFLFIYLLAIIHIQLISKVQHNTRSHSISKNGKVMM